MAEKVLILPGDGIGPSLMESVETVLGITTDAVELVKGDIGLTAYEATGQYIPHETWDLLDECKTIICGPTVPLESGTDPVLSLRTQLDLFAKARRFLNLSPDLGVQDMDVTMWCSNSDVANEVTEVPDIDGITLSRYIRSDSYHLMMNIALDDAEIRKMTKISCITNSAMFPKSGGMFIETFDSMFPPEDYEVRHIDVGKWAKDVVRNPYHDQCVICGNMCSDAVEGVLCGLSGYGHICPECYVGNEYIMYKPCNSASIDFDEGFANPTSAILSLYEIIHDLGLKDESETLLKAVRDTYAAGERTPDVGGTLTTTEFTDCVCKRI